MGTPRSELRDQRALFEGDEQDRLSREITPVSHAYELETIASRAMG